VYQCIRSLFCLQELKQEQGASIQRNETGKLLRRGSRGDGNRLTGDLPDDETGYDTHFFLQTICRKRNF
jgi:hypothetical protein